MWQVFNFHLPFLSLVYSGISSRNAKHHKTNCSPGSSSPEGRTKCWKYGKEVCTMSYPQIKHPPFKRLLSFCHKKFLIFWHQLSQLQALTWFQHIKSTEINTQFLPAPRYFASHTNQLQISKNLVWNT